MNQGRIIIAIVAAGLVLLAVIFFSGKKPIEKPLVQTGVDHPRPGTPVSGSVPALPSPEGGVSALVSVERALHTPISFYGKVVDQSGVPVPDADVRAEANDHAVGAHTVKTLKADGNGFFEIQGMHGIQLAVGVSKEGYYKLNHTAASMGSAGGFRYYSMGGESVYVPDRQKPVVFILFKQGQMEKLDPISSRWVGLSAGGREVVLDMTPRGDTVHRRIVIRAWNSKPAMPNSPRYDWRAEVQPANGGICPRKGDLEFEAPEVGYQPLATIEMPASLPTRQWHDVVKEDFFVRFDDNVFARIAVDLAAPPNGSVSITGYLNPTIGSRNLERDPKLR